MAVHGTPSSSLSRRMRLRATMPEVLKKVLFTVCLFVLGLVYYSVRTFAQLLNLLVYILETY